LGRHTWGDSCEAAALNAQEALNPYLETLRANGDPLPMVGEITSDVELGVIVRRPVAA